MKRSPLAAAAALLGGVLAAAFAATSKPSFDERWTATHDDLIAVQASISEEKLHARALKSCARLRQCK